jgi:hypothetical protein
MALFLDNLMLLQECDSSTDSGIKTMSGSAVHWHYYLFKWVADKCKLPGSTLQLEKPAWNTCEGAFAMFANLYS